MQEPFEACAERLQEPVTRLTPRCSVMINTIIITIIIRPLESVMLMMMMIMMIYLLSLFCRL